MTNLGQYPSPMDPMGLWVNGIIAVNESMAKTTRFRLAGDTHLIAWPDISLLGENLRFKDTEYSEVRVGNGEEGGRNETFDKLSLVKQTKHILLKGSGYSYWVSFKGMNSYLQFYRIHYMKTIQIQPFM